MYEVPAVMDPWNNVLQRHIRHIKGLQRSCAMSALAKPAWVQGNGSRRSALPLVSPTVTPNPYNFFG